MNKSRRADSRLDRLAIIFSVTCLVHCFAFPLLVAVTPLLGTALLSDRMFHWYLLVLVLPLSVVALLHGFRRHASKLISGIGAVGLAVLIVAAVAGHDLPGAASERLVTSVGSILVAVAHLLNQRNIGASLSR